MDKNEVIFAAVDIGSTKVVALAGKKVEDNKIQIIGLGHSASRGIKRGVVLNVDEAYAAVNDAVSQAERDCGQTIENIFVNISGQHLTTLTARVQRTIGRDRSVTESDILQMTEQARQINIPEDMSIYHVNSEFYTIDSETGITSPVGTIGEKIEGTFKVHIAPEAYLRNITTCFKKGLINVQKPILDPIASSEVVLTEDEKEAGVALVDIGGGTTKISIFCDGVLCYTSMVPFGGNVLTHDIKEGCSITVKQAESLKVQFGQAIADFAPEDKVVTIPIQGWEPRQISFKALANIIQARMEEIVDGFAFQIKKSGYADKLGAGIVITGGTSLLPNLSQLIKYRTGFDVRKGKPNLNNFIARKEVDDPRYSTVLGLMKMAAEEEGQVGKKRKKLKIKSNEPGIVEKMQKRIVQGVIGFFEENQADTEMNQDL
ncbi:MAG TPA: cell division protein FtsA [Prolixibacteraceae bacterium]|jgi:cell division protein FtsA|nr:cell division protein FtsA [Prolixibacteraceae bacterium]